MRTDTKMKYMGLIECGASLDPGRLDAMARETGFSLKKVFAARDPAVNLTIELSPGTELVQDRASLLDDSSIELIILSSPGREDMSLATEVLESGKFLRIFN